MSKISDTIRKLHHSYCTVVVVAAGQSERMGEDKLFLEIGGMPVLARTLAALNQSEAVDEIIVVTREERFEAVGGLRETYGIDKLTKLILGGETRTGSALAGAVAASRKAKIICIHDGARPFVTHEVIADAVHHAVLYQAAAPAVPLKDTVKKAEKGVVSETPDRKTLFAVQTPQAFQADIVKAALTKAAKDGVSYTDDCAAAEALGCVVRLSKGDEDNIKITTPADLALAEAILKKREAIHVQST